MGRRQTGGDSSGVKKIMINNLCKETKNGDTLKDKDASSFVQVQNLCTTANETNMEETASHSVNNSANQTAAGNNNTSGAVSSSFSGGNLLFNIGSMMTMPMRKMLGLVGVDTGKLTENAKNKVNSMLNKNVEEKVKEDTDAEDTSKTVVSKSNIEEKIVNRLENLSGGRRRTKKGKGKVRGKGNGNKSSKRRRNRTKRR
jgi:hypothetical protein